MILGEKIMFYFFAEFAEPSQKLFQDAATPIMSGIMDLHHYIFMFLIAIFIFVLLMLSTILTDFIFWYDSSYYSNPSLAKAIEKVIVKINYFVYRRFFYATYLLRFLDNFINKFVYPSNIKTVFTKKIKAYLKNKIFLILVKKLKNQDYKISLDSNNNINRRLYWNSFWHILNVATVNYSTYTKRFRLQDKFLLKDPLWIVLNWSIPTNNISKEDFSIGLIESTIDNARSETYIPSEKNLKSETGFAIALYSVLYTIGKSYPLRLLSKGKHSFERPYIPTRSKFMKVFYPLSFYGDDVTGVFNSYVENLIYRIHVHLNVKSGIYRFTHNTLVEIIWTIIPSLILVFIGVPSFILLYAMDEIIEPVFIVKCIGHQWYWSYEIEHPKITNNVINLEKIIEDLDSIFKNLSLLNIFAEESTEFNENLESIHDLFFDMLICSVLDSGNDFDSVKFCNELIFNYLNSVKITLENYDENVSFMSFIDQNINTILFNNNDSIKDIFNKIVEIKENVINDNIYSNFSSYLVNEGDLKNGDLRLLEVDNPLILPVNTHIDLLITADDVLHSWTVPSFGLKCDAVPGRLNHANLFIERPGIFYGQCSEICGVNHGFMPIKVEVLS